MRNGLTISRLINGNNKLEVILSVQKTIQSNGHKNLFGNLKCTDASSITIIV